MDDNEVEIRVTIRDDAAAGEAKVRARVKRMGSDLERDTSDSGDKAGKGFLGRFRESLNKGSGAAGGLASKLVSSLMGTFELSAKTLATGFSYQFTTTVAAGLASGAAKMVHGLAAIGALLPAMAATALLAFGTVKLAISGVGDALKAGLAGDTKKFEESLKGLAPAARGFAHEVVGMRSQLTGLKNTVQQNFFSEFSGEASRLGKTFLPMLRAELGGVATSMGFAVQNAAGFLRTPKAVLAIKVSLQNMGATITNVTAGLGGMLQALLPLVAVGSTFLPKLTGGFADAADRAGAFMTRAAETGKLADFIQRGLDKLQALGHTASRVWNIAKNIWSVFKQLGGFGSVLSGLGIKSGGLLDQLEELTKKASDFFSTSAGGKAMAEAIRTIRELLNASMGMFAKLAGIIAPFAPQIAEFATAIENFLTAIVDAAAPVIQVLLGKVLPVLTTLINMISRNGPVMKGILIGLFAAWVAGAGAAAIETLIAAAPFIALGVIVAGLAALFITHFDTIKKVVSGVWNWIKDHWQMLAAIFIGPLAYALPWIKDHLRDIRDFFSRIVAAIRAGAGGMWSPMLSGLIRIVDGIAAQIERVLQLYHKLPGTSGGVMKGQFSTPSVAKGGGGGGTMTKRAHGGITGGLAQLAERGAELMKMPGGGPQGTMMMVPHGSQVYDAGSSKRMMGGGTTVIEINLNVAGNVWSSRDLISMFRNEMNKGGFGGFIN